MKLKLGERWRRFWDWWLERYPPECGGRTSPAARPPRAPGPTSGCRYADGRDAGVGHVVSGRESGGTLGGRWIAGTVLRTYPDGALDLAYVELVPIERMVGKEVRVIDLRNGKWPPGGGRLVAMVTRIRTHRACDFRRIDETD